MGKEEIEKNSSMENIKFDCCFCKLLIDEDQIDPIGITITINADLLDISNTKEMFFAHFSCFKQNMHQLANEHFITNISTKFVANTNYLIQEIIKLKNTNQWNVIFYGLEHNYINWKFVLDYCYALIEQKNSKDPFVLDIAALTNNDDIEKLLTTKVNHEIMHDKKFVYKKLWIYLSLGADLVDMV